MPVASTSPDGVDLLSAWVGLAEPERAAVREVYFAHRSIEAAAARRGLTASEVARSLQRAHRRIAATLLAASQSPPAGPSATRVPPSAIPVCRWRWDTTREEMTWSDGLYTLYGYPPGTVRATIGLHQAHKHPDDRVRVEGLVLAAATARGPVVLPQRVVRTDGSTCRVVMHVARAPGRGEVLTGRVVADHGGVTSAGTSPTPR